MITGQGIGKVEIPHGGHPAISVNWYEGMTEDGYGDKLQMKIPISLLKTKPEDVNFYIQAPAKAIYESLKRIYEPHEAKA